MRIRSGIVGVTDVGRLIRGLPMISISCPIPRLFEYLWVLGGRTFGEADGFTFVAVVVEVGLAVRL